MIHGSYSRSYFNLFILHTVARDAHKYKPSPNVKTVLIVQKIDLIQKYFVNVPNFNIKKPLVGPFSSPKNLNLTSLKLSMQVLLVGTFAVHANGYCK